MAYSRKWMSSKPAVCSMTMATVTGCVLSQAVREGDLGRQLADRRVEIQETALHGV